MHCWSLWNHRHSKSLPCVRGLFRYWYTTWLWSVSEGGSLSRTRRRYSERLPINLECSFSSELPVDWGLCCKRSRLKSLYQTEPFYQEKVFCWAPHHVSGWGHECPLCTDECQCTAIHSKCWSSAVCTWCLPPIWLSSTWYVIFLLTCGLCCYRGKTPSSCLNIDSSLASHIPQRWMKGLVILQPTTQRTQLWYE